MITNEEKKEFVGTIFERIPEDATKELAEKEIMRVLLEDTSGGKLYKYRKINDYSIRNLEEGTLYCASPSELNDPFDCKIGIDILSFLVEQYEEVISKGIQYFSKFEELVVRGSGWEECSDEEKQIFHYWKENSEIYQFVKNSSDLVQTFEEKKELIWDNYAMLVEIVKGLLLDNTLEPLVKVLITVLEKSKKDISLMKEKNLLFGKTSVGDFLKASGVEIDADDITLISSLYRMSYPDNAEIANSVDRDLNEISERLSEDMDKEYRIGCLGTDCKNVLMWSHYAEGHKGFCIEYDFGEGLENLDCGLLLPVIYSQERVIFPWRILFNNAEDNEIKLEGAYAKIFTLLTKDEMWKYENEWRIIIPTNVGKKNIKMPRVTCIYLGVLCPEKDRKILIEIAQKHKIPVKQMVIGRSRYSLHAHEINSLEDSK